MLKKKQKLRRWKSIGVSFNQNELNKINQAKEILKIRLGKDYALAKMLRMLIIRQCDQLIESELTDLRFLDS